MRCIKLTCSHRLYKHGLERCEGVLAATIDEIMARCDQETPGYEAATYKDAITPSEFFNRLY